MYDTIFSILSYPKDTSLADPRFRYWVNRRGFSLENGIIVCKDRKGKPHATVAIKEEMYSILLKVSTNLPGTRSHFAETRFGQAHGGTRHLGRDRTSLEARRGYSYVPKALIARFLLCCPTCHKRARALSMAWPQICNGSPLFVVLFGPPDDVPDWEERQSPHATHRLVRRHSRLRLTCATPGGASRPSIC
jgi:hypothetical protein